MKPICFRLFFLAVLFLVHCSLQAQTCSTNWLKLPSSPAKFTIGDLDVPGHTITVEALITRTTPWSPTNDFYQGDVVSKHLTPDDVNYLLRPGSAEITTYDALGHPQYFKTPAICNIQLNKTYHVAFTYDGSRLKFYRNGYLMSQVAASGELFQNNFAATVGLFSGNVSNEQMIGYVNEVRIWNVVRTQQEIRNNMHISLSSPATQPGLLAYYTFDNLLNKQGNATWNGTLNAPATINEANANCNLVIDSCNVVLQAPTPGFIAPDTVCLGMPVNITNSSINASTYYWNFCSADVNQTPSAQNIGNPGGFLSQPVFMDIASDNGNYYAFVVNHNPGGLTRLDFGNSLLNTPTAVSLGNPGNILNSGYGSEGIQVVKNNGKWYAVIVGGTPSSSGTPRLGIIRFGTNITNISPAATNYGNIGVMKQPMDLYMFQDNGVWYGFTVNAETNSITRFNFTNNLDNPPTGSNLGNIGGLDYPTGVCTVNDNGIWRTFVNNAANNGSITRLDFGTSLLNTPTGVNLGNPSNALTQPRDITILKYCGQSIGFITDQTDKLIKLNFSSLSATPSAVNLGNLGNMSFPHSLSKLFREGNDLYSMVTNVSNNTITRMKFAGCTSASLPASTAQTPPAVTYNQPGTYNINLTIDDGLPTQGTFCKQVVVLPGIPHHPIQTLNICSSDSLKIGPATQYNNIWNGSVSADSIWVYSSGLNYVDQTNAYCANRDSFTVVANPYPVVNLGPDSAICHGGTIALNAGNAGATYLWNNGTQQQTLAVSDTGFYIVRVTNAGCVKSDTVHIAFFIHPQFQSIADTSVCLQSNLVLQTQGSGADSYSWTPSAGLNNAQQLSPTANITAPVQFIGTATDIHGCTTKDTVNVTVQPSPTALLGPDKALCAGQVVTLGAANSGSTYSWNTGATSQTIQVSNPGQYIVAVSNGSCMAKDTIQVNVASLPTVNLGVDTSICKSSSLTLNAGNPGASYQWLDNSVQQTFLVSDTGYYAVTVTDANSCVSHDSIHISWRPVPAISSIPDTSICAGTPVTLATTGSSGYTYSWSPSTGLNNAALQNPIANPSANTNYILTVTDINGCHAKDTVAVAVKPMPTLSLGPDKTYCVGTSMILGSTSSGTVIWGDGSSGPNFTASDTGYYHASVTSQGCKVSDTVHISYYPKPAIQTLSDSAVCDQSVIILTTTATNVAQYQWSPSTGLSNPNIGSPSLQVTGNGQYIVKGTSPDGCIISDTVNITRTPLPVVSLGQDQTLCTGVNITLDAGNPGASFLWNGGSMVQTLSVSTPGLYYVTVTKANCSAADSINITPVTAAIFSLNPLTSSLCALDSVKLTASGASTYDWFTPSGSLGQYNATLMAYPSVATTYSVILNDTVCHVLDTLSTVLTVLPAPNVQLSLENPINCLTPSSRILASGAIQYQWLPAKGITDLNSATPTIRPQQTTTYTVLSTGTNGCKAIDSLQVQVNYTGQSLFFIPDMFTPNGDGKNDCFGVKFWAPAETFEMSIYNRWGERVFYTQNQNECWNGVYQGKTKPDVYVYYIKVTSSCGVAFKKGTLTLVQ